MAARIFRKKLTRTNRGSVLRGGSNAVTSGTVILLTTGGERRRLYYRLIIVIYFRRYRRNNRIPVILRRATVRLTVSLTNTVHLPTGFSPQNCNDLIFQSTNPSADSSHRRGSSILHTVSETKTGGFEEIFTVHRGTQSNGAPGKNRISNSCVFVVFNTFVFKNRQVSSVVEQTH